GHPQPIRDRGPRHDRQAGHLLRDDGAEAEADQGEPRETGSVDRSEVAAARHDEDDLHQRRHQNDGVRGRRPERADRTRGVLAGAVTEGAEAAVTEGTEATDLTQSSGGTEDEQRSPATDGWLRQPSHGRKKPLQNTNPIARAVCVFSGFFRPRGPRSGPVARTLRLSPLLRLSV